MKSCIILCGGKGRRIGKDKGLLIVKNKPMILHVIDAIEDIVDEIIIALRDQKQVEKYKGALSNKNAFLRFCTDKIKDRGPLGGILTGLLNIHSEYALVLPCDSPFVRKSFILKMFRFAEDDDFDALVPIWDDGHVEPLHSIYKKSVIKVINNLLEEGVMDVKSLLGRLNVRYIDVKMLDKSTRSFKNINTAEDISFD